MKSEVGRRKAEVLSVAIWLALVLSVALAGAQTADTPTNKEAEDPGAKSLPFRTALYHDPTLGAPLDRLLQIYREGNRVKELLDLYRLHLSQYPADTGSQIVLLRLLLAAGDTEAGPRIRAAAQQFPDVGYLQFLLYEQLQPTKLADALAALDRAIDKEPLPARKRAWTELLIPQAMTAGRPDLAEKHLRAWAARDTTPDEKLETARVMIANRFFQPALETLDAANALSPSAETGVEIQMTAATAETGLNQGEAAAARLDKLLARLTADYWRRAEILRRRAALVKSDAERQTMLQAARKRVADAPHDEAAALDLAQLLDSFEFRREALTALLAAGTQLPGSEKIEHATLDLFDRLRDERQREEYLAARLQAQPARQDLAALRVRTLFGLGRRQEALAALDPLAQGMDPSARINYLLELARALRRASLPGDAAEVFQRVLALAPDRYEVRRELAETYLALGRNDKARALFANGPPADVPPENLGEVIQFMSKQGLLVEARDALAKRLAADPANFDLRLLALELAGKLGDRAAGDTLLDATRALADTGARYRRWLEAGAAFAEIFEDKAAFFQTEAARLDPGPHDWTKEALERQLAYAELAAHNDRKDEAQEMLRADLAGQMPAEMRVELRRKLVDMLALDPAQSTAVQEQLQALARDDPARADEYRVRQAITFQRDKRTDLMMSVLGISGANPGTAPVDVNKLGDPALLSGLDSILTENANDPRLKTAIQRRITELDPTNRGAWERWIRALALSGDETGLRQTLRRLLAGIDRLPLSPGTRDLLQEALGASYWRAIHALLNDEKTADAALADALASLDAAESLFHERDSWLWVGWTRAYLLNRLGRDDARDKAIAELARVTAERPPRPAPGPVNAAAVANIPGLPGLVPMPTEIPAPPAPQDDTPRIVFPDGVAIDLRDARELLTARPSAAGPALRASRTGPVGSLRARWAFDTDGRAAIVQILPLETGRTLITDQKGKNYCLDAQTGKVLWSRAGAPAITPQQSQNGIYYGNVTQQVSFAKAAFDGAGRVLVPAAGRIECLRAATGELLWRATLSNVTAGQTIFPALFCAGEKVLACAPGAGEVFAFDRATGKRLWDCVLPASTAQTAPPLHALNTGASLSGRRLFIYGARTAVLDADSGAVEWIFDPAAVRELPVSLKETDAPPAAAAPVLPPGSFAGGGFSGRRIFRSGGTFGSLSGFGGSGMNAMQTINYLNADGSVYHSMSGNNGAQVQLAAPAVVWAASSPMRHGLLDGERLLLFNEGGMRIARLDLPFRSKEISLQGTFAGMSGSVACILWQGGLRLADTVSGNVAQFWFDKRMRPEPSPDDEEEETDDSSGQPGGRVQAVVDGPVIYLSRPEGITCVNAQTAEEIFSAPWPANVAPPAAGPAVSQAPNQGSGVSLAQAARQTPRAQYLWAGVSTSDGQQEGPVYPLADRVQDGLLLATVTASRVVALEGAPAH